MLVRAHRRNDAVRGLGGIALVVGLLTLGVIPAPATPPQFQITIESGSPYYFPAAATVTTGTATPHPQKNSQVKTERVTSEMLEQAGATHVGQSLQDVPGVQPRR